MPVAALSLACLPRVTPAQGQVSHFSFLPRVICPASVCPGSKRARGPGLTFQHSGRTKLPT